MTLCELIQPADILVPFDPRDKWDALDQLMERVSESSEADADQVSEWREQVFARERSMSTGMERGIAIPHAAVDGLEGVRASVGVVQREEGLAFESIDGKSTVVVVLLLIPRAQKLAHIRTLADVARVLGKDSVRSALLVAESGRQAWEVIHAETQAS